jgi:hypothetical protein
MSEGLEISARQMTIGPRAGGEMTERFELVNRVTTTYLGERRARVAAGERAFDVDQRTHIDRPGAGFCPLELVAAALGT